MSIKATYFPMSAHRLVMLSLTTVPKSNLQVPDFDGELRA